MPPTDVAFTFDPMPVLNGVRRIDDGISNLSRGMARSSQNMSKAITAGVLKAGAVIGTLAGAFKGVQAVLKRMPEIGEVFGIAKDIFFRNFLFPIRQALLPLLQQLLDWVRDNRGLFVRWGMAVANAVRIVVRVIRNMVQLLQSVGRNLLRWLGFRDLDEFVNILQFKIAAVLIGIRVIAKGVADQIRSLWAGIGDEATAFGANLFDTITTVIDDILGWIEKLTAGFTGSFDLGGNLENIIDMWNRYVDVFRDLWNTLFRGERGERWDRFFEGLGSLIGSAINVFVAGMTALHRVLTDIIKDFIQTPGFQLWADFISQIAGGLGDIFALGADQLDRLTEWFNKIGRGDEDGQPTEQTEGQGAKVLVPTTPGNGGNTTTNEISFIQNGVPLSNPLEMQAAAEDGLQRAITASQELEGIT